MILDFFGFKWVIFVVFCMNTRICALDAVNSGKTTALATFLLFQVVMKNGGPTSQRGKHALSRKAKQVQFLDTQNFSGPQPHSFPINFHLSKKLINEVSLFS